MEKAQAELHRMGIGAVHNMIGAISFEALQLVEHRRLKTVTQSIAQDNLDDAIDLGLSSGFGDEYPHRAA